MDGSKQTLPRWKNEEYDGELREDSEDEDPLGIKEVALKRLLWFKCVREGSQEPRRPSGAGGWVGVKLDSAGKWGGIASKQTYSPFFTAFPAHFPSNILLCLHLPLPPCLKQRPLRNAFVVQSWLLHCSIIVFFRCLSHQSRLRPRVIGVPFFKTMAN